MIHSWELALFEMTLPIIFFFLGLRIHRYLKWPMAILGFLLAEWFIAYTLTHGMVGE